MPERIKPTMERHIAENGVVFYRSAMLSPLRHGFSTRRGGISTLAHTAEMNLAFGRGDDDEVVIANLDRFCTAVGIDAGTVISLPQVHSDEVIYAADTMRGAGYFFDLGKSCDGYVTDRKNVAIGVKIADCVPILLSDQDAGVIAAIHAGWKGTALEIVRGGIQMMREKGADPNRITVAIGPSIGQCCYEIGQDVAEKLTNIPGAANYIRPSKSATNKYYADLKAINYSLLTKAGIPPANIDMSALCTCCMSDIFHSHRKTGGQRGTMIALISL